MTTLDRLPMLERRRIQAEVVKPIWEALAAEAGREVANRVIGKAIKDAAIEEGRRFAEAEGGPGGMEGFLAMQHLWTAGGALEAETVEASATDYISNVTRCRYAEMYREMGVEEVGFLLSCNRDGTFVEGYDPRIRLTRTQTIMQGADHCDFHYRMTQGDDA